MKFSKLLVLGAMLLTGGTAMATIVDGVRQAPEVATTQFAEGSSENYYYLYNTSAKMFYTQGNTWGTRACVGPYASAIKIYFAASAAGDGSYNLGNYTNVRSTTSYSWRFSSAEGKGHALYADQGTGWGRPNWSITATEGNIFRIVNTTPYFAEDETDPGVTLYMGYDVNVAQDFYNAWAEFKDDNRRYPVSDNLAEGEGHHIDWALVAPADYEAMADAWQKYDKSVELKAVLDEAKAASVNVADEEAIYLNEASTVEQMDQAIADVKEKIKNAAASAATPTNPADMTTLIQSADCASKNGWKGTDFALGSGAAEHYNKNYDTYQVVKAIPQGVYMLGVQGYYRAGNTEAEFKNQNDPTKRHAKLYAVAGNDTVYQPLTSNFKYEGNPVGVNGETTYTDPVTSITYTVPNTMASGAAYFARGDYKNSLYFGVPGDTAKIGLVKTERIDADWTLWDNWTLKYLGNTAEAYTFWVNEAKKGMTDYATALQGTIFTQKYLDTYNTAIANATATDYDSAIAALNAIKAAADSLEKNVDLWKEYQMIVDSAAVVMNDESLMETYRDAVTLLFYYYGEWTATPNDYDNAALEAKIAEFVKAIEDAVKHPSGERDMTESLLKNADFSKGKEGWIGFNTVASQKWNDSQTLNMPTTGGATNTCAEAFSSPDFDLYQVVENAPVGVYEISVQGFYRYGRGDNAWNWYQAQEAPEVKPGGSPVFVYLNAKATPFANVFGEPVTEGYYKGVNSNAEVYVKDGQEFPDGMISASIAFADGMYTQKAYGLVAKAGDVMRIGVKGNSTQTNDHDCWVIFDNFKLVWKGYQAEIIKPVLEEEIAKAKTRANEIMGKSAYENLTAAIKAAEEALTGGDGETMFNALSGLFDVDAEVTASIRAFADLANLLVTFGEEIATAKDVKGESDPDVQAAIALQGQIEGNLGNHTIAESDIEGLIAQINEMITKLRIRNADSATDDNPVDFTSVINNPGYNVNAEGWSGTTPGHDAAAGVAEFYNKTFDFYQDIAGLPAGTYRVAVSAFYRPNWAPSDYERRDSTEYSMAFLYAVGNGQTSSKAITRLSSVVMSDVSGEEKKVNDAVTTFSGFDNGERLIIVAVDTLDAENKIYRYNMLGDNTTAARTLFDAGHFGGDKVTGDGNVVTVKVGEDGKLRIGLKNEVKVGTDWTCFSDWQLWYFGNESTKEVNDDPSGITEVNAEGNAARVEFFTLDGRRAAASQKGILIQKMIFTDGSVMVRKVRK